MSAPRTAFTVRKRDGSWYDAGYMVGSYEDPETGVPFNREGLARWVRRENRRLELEACMSAAMADMDTEAGATAVLNAIFYGSSGRFVLRDLRVPE